MISSQELSSAQFGIAPAAILASVFIASEQEGIGHLPAKASRHVYEANEPNYQRDRDTLVLGPKVPFRVGFQHFGLLVQDQPHGPASGNNREGFVRGV